MVSYFYDEYIVSSNDSYISDDNSIFNESLDYNSDPNNDDDNGINNVSVLIQKYPTYDKSTTKYMCVHPSFFPLHTHFELMKLQNVQLAKTQREAQRKA